MAKKNKKHQYKYVFLPRIYTGFYVETWRAASLPRVALRLQGSRNKIFKKYEKKYCIIIKKNDTFAKKHTVRDKYLIFMTGTD